ncbi:MAG TPA: hypothetical protein VKR32_06060 [Puia sp.]|nr:hypothetical protein [Puia sp.]
MKIMEFDELKKIWDGQNNKPLYVLDEKALHNRIQSKMNKGLRIANISELVLIIVYLGAGSLMISLNGFKSGANIFMYVEAVWMFATVAYVVMGRIRRIKASRRFDRSVDGDLNHAIALATYQLRLSQITIWNLLPMGAIMIFSGLEAGKLLKVSAVILVSFALALYVGRKGIRADKNRKRELQALKEKLESGN